LIDGGVAEAGRLPALTAYLLGVFGSFCVEAVAALNACAKKGGVLPPLYKKPAYLILRLIVAVTAAGGLPYVLHAANEMAALYLGANAPLVFDRIQRGASPNGR
jgi:hypothetical protein